MMGMMVSPGRGAALNVPQGVTLTFFGLDEEVANEGRSFVKPSPL